MALFAAIGDKFVSVILRQVAHDYSLDYKELKNRYCGKSSFEHFTEADVNPEISTMTITVPATVKPKTTMDKPPKTKTPKPKEPKASKPASDQMALSKMKKPDLILELVTLGLDTTGTVPILKERVKAARAGVAPAPTDQTPKPVKTKKTKKKDQVPVTHNHPPTDEVVDDCDLCDSHGNALSALRAPADPEETQDLQFDEMPSLQARLQALLSEGAEVESDEDEDSEASDDEDQQETPTRDRWEALEEED